MQAGQTPQVGSQESTTLSPGATRVTAVPMRSTMPPPFVAEHRRHRRRRRTRGGVPVAVAHAARLDADEHLGGAWCRELNRLDDEVLARCFEYGRECLDTSAHFRHLREVSPAGFSSMRS